MRLSPARLFPVMVATLMPAFAIAQETDAQDTPAEVTAEAVWSSEEIDTCTRRPWDKAFDDCMSTLGAPEEAVRFAEALLADPAIATAGILTGFTEYGLVDLAEVLFPALANANQQVLFVNGTPALIQPGALEIGQPEDRVSLSILAEHPDAMLAGPPVISGYRDLPEGTQRFVLTDRVTEGCRACEVLAIAVTHVDFTDGVLSAVTPAAWAPVATALEGEEAETALNAGDAAVVQYRLLAAGFAPGGVDGRTGPMTLAALDSFLAENCLTARVAEPEIRAPAVAVLAGVAGSACAAAPGTTTLATEDPDAGSPITDVEAPTE